MLSFCKEILTVWPELHFKNPFTAKEYDNNSYLEYWLYENSWETSLLSFVVKKGIIKIGHQLNGKFIRKFLSRSEFQQKRGLSVNFLTYSCFIAAIPMYGKDFERIPTDVDNFDLSPTTVTDKTEHEPLVL